MTIVARAKKKTRMGLLAKLGCHNFARLVLSEVGGPNFVVNSFVSLNGVIT